MRRTRYLNRNFNKKKKKQRGGLSALSNATQSIFSFSKTKTDKLVLNRSKEYIQKQNKSFEYVLNYVSETLNEKNSLFEKQTKIMDFCSSRTGISFYKKEKNTIFITSWTQGPPVFEFDTDDFNIREEEKYSATLCTILIDFTSPEVKYSVHQNGIVVSIHAISRFFERVNSFNDLQIKKELDKIIPWGAVISSLVRNKTSFMKQISVPSKNGVWMGAFVLSKDKNRNNEYTPVLYLRTFVSNYLLSFGQLEIVNDLKNNKNTQYKIEDKNIYNFLSHIVPPEKFYSSFGISKIIEAKNYFFSEDKFSTRIQKYIENQKIDFNKIIRPSLKFNSFNTPIKIPRDITALYSI